VPVSGPVLLLVSQLHLPNASLDMRTFTRSGLPVAEAGFGDSCHSFCCVSLASCSLFLSLLLLSLSYFSPSSLRKHLIPPSFNLLKRSSSKYQLFKQDIFISNDLIRVPEISSNLNHLFFVLLNRPHQEATKCFSSLDNIPKTRTSCCRSSFPSTTSQAP
jgi:hypothetical protein